MNEPSGLAAKLKSIDGKFVPSSGILKNATVMSKSLKVAAEEDVKEGGQGDACKDNSQLDKDVTQEQKCADGGTDPSSEPKKNQPTYADSLKVKANNRKVNFRKVENSMKTAGIDVYLPRESVRLMQDKMANTIFGYFLGERLAYPVVEYFVKQSWTKYGLTKVMMNSNGYFFLQVFNF